MAKWTTRRLIIRWFGIAVVILGILAASAWYSMERFSETSSWMNHTRDALSILERIKTDIYRAESSQRGYLINLSKDRRQKREEALARLAPSIQQAALLTIDDPEQQARIQELKESIAKRIATFHYYENFRINQGLMALDSIGVGGDAISNRIGDIIDQMQARETRLLQERQEQEQVRMQIVWAGRAVLLIGLILFLPILFLLISRNIHREKNRLILKKSEALLKQILGSLPVGVFVSDSSGAITMINPASCHIWGGTPPENISDFNRHPIWLLKTGKKITVDQSGLTRALRHGEVSLNTEYEIQRPDGSRRIVCCSSIPLHNDSQRITGAISVQMDVTDLKRTEQALQSAYDELEIRVAERTAELLHTNILLRMEIEERKRTEEALQHTQHILTSAQRVGHVGSWEINMATEKMQWSDEFFRICGLQPTGNSASMEAYFSLVHPDDCEASKIALHQTLREHVEYKVAMRIVHPDGSIRHVLNQAEVVQHDEQKPMMLIGSLLDITEQKLVEQTLRRFAMHQEWIKEEERKRIAREIHDEMGQNLMALRIDASMLHGRTASTHPRLHAKVTTVLQNIDDTIKNVRSIINNLRPAVLDLGLHAAIDWQVREFQQRSGIVCKLSMNPANFDAGLNDDQTTALFRILQESLTNVARHSKARCVHIALERTSDKLQMTIRDDGVGILPGAWEKPKSFGLVGIKERVSAIDGELEVGCHAGKGVALLISIPVEPIKLQA